MIYQLLLNLYIPLSTVFRRTVQGDGLLCHANNHLHTICKELDSLKTVTPISQRTVPLLHLVETETLNCTSPRVDLHDLQMLRKFC